MELQPSTSPPGSVMFLPDGRARVITGMGSLVFAPSRSFDLQPLGDPTALPPGTVMFFSDGRARVIMEGLVYDPPYSFDQQPLGAAPHANPQAQHVPGDVPPQPVKREAGPTL